MNKFILASAAVAVSAALSAPASAALVSMSNGLAWDIDDSTGEVVGDGLGAFDRYGTLRLRVSDGSSNLLVGNQRVSNLDLSLSGRTHTTTTPASIGGVSVSRTIFAPAGTNLLRYSEAFTNTTSEVRNLEVAWGGNLGSDADTFLTATSSGDRDLSGNDTFAVVIEGSTADGPATDPVAGMLFRNTTGASFLRTGSDGTSVFSRLWGGDGGGDGNQIDRLSLIYGLALNPGQTLGLAFFLYNGLEEDVTGPLGQTPAGGSEIALAVSTLSGLTEQQLFGDLSADERARILNFGPANAVPAPGTLLLALAGLAALRATRRR